MSIKRMTADVKNAIALLESRLETLNKSIAEKQAERKELDKESEQAASRAMSAWSSIDTKSGEVAQIKKAIAALKGEKT